MNALVQFSVRTVILNMGGKGRMANGYESVEMEISTTEVETKLGELHVLI